MDAYLRDSETEETSWMLTYVIVRLKRHHGCLLT